MHVLIYNTFLFSLHDLNVKKSRTYGKIDMFSSNVRCFEEQIFSVCSVADVGQFRGCLLESAYLQLSRIICCHVRLFV